MTAHDFGGPQTKNQKEHEIIKRLKIEKAYVKSENADEAVFFQKMLPVEYEQFRCNKERKLVTLEAWDFNFCPFCGDVLGSS